MQALGAKLNNYDASSTSNYTVGSTGYATLAAAVSGASSGSTITVNNDVTDASTSNITISKNITIELGNYDVTLPVAITVNKGYTLNRNGTGDLRFELASSSDTAGIVVKGTLNLTNGATSLYGETSDVVIDNYGTVNLSSNILRTRQRNLQ